MNELANSLPKIAAAIATGVAVWQGFANQGAQHTAQIATTQVNGLVEHFMRESARKDDQLLRCHEQLDEVLRSE